jgi:uncharacterized membrane protein
MDLMRIVRHRTAINRTGKQLFNKATMLRIQAAIATGERTHRGEVRLIVESSMPLRKLWRGMTARQRALDLFGSFRVWDTVEQNGVLLYINLADHALEVISDRTASRLTRDQHWLFACQLAQEAFKHGEFERGAIAAIEAIHQALAMTFPAEGAVRRAEADAALR